MLRSVEFKSTFANDWQFTAGGDPIAPGARELADVIVRELSSRMRIVEPVEQHSYYGWAFAVEFAGCRFDNVINPGNQRCYLTVRLCWQWLRALLLQHPQQRFEEYCKVLSAVLGAIPQLSNVTWQEYKH
jgi:hypothetical protein